MNDKQRYKNEFEEEGEITYESEIVCPWCFEEQEKVELHGAYEEGEHENTCDNCNKTFYFTTSITIDYSSRREIEDD